MSTGYLYVAYGRAHLAEAFRSLKSLRKADPEAHVTLVTTTTKRDHPWDQFNQVISSPHLPQFLGGKVERFHAYYDKTIYLDTDTWICESPRPLFQLLDWYNVVVAPDPGEIEIDGLVAPNTGVVAFDATQATEEFLDNYRAWYTQKPELWQNHPGRKQHTDQPSFALALADSEVSALWVPQNWNFRYRFHAQLNPGPVRIIHGPDCDFKKLQKEANRKLGGRCWDPKHLRLA